MNGLVLGRFMPLHKGHCYLIDFALSMCSSLHICICSRHDDPIAGHLRYKWIREQFPQAQVHHITKEIPEANVQNPNAPKIWAEEITTHIMADIQYFFASENYGWDFAQHIGATFIPLDFDRNNIHISASKIRNAPLLYWNYLPPSVQRFTMMLIGIKGDTEYAKRLASDFNVKVVCPYPLKHIHAQKQQLSDEEYTMIITSEIHAMHNFGYPFLFMAFDVPLQDTEEHAKHTIESHACRKVFTIQSEKEYEEAYDYCTTLLHSPWQELFLV